MCKRENSRTFLISNLDLIRFFSYDIRCTIFNTASSDAPDFTVSEDAGIEPRTVATTALADALTTQLDLIRYLDLILYCPSLAVNDLAAYL